MAILVRLRFTVTCDTCKKEIASFRAFSKGGDEIFFADGIICDNCFEAKEALPEQKKS